jgi:hypothetical protein
MTARKVLPDMAWHSRAACNPDNSPEVPPAWFAPLTYRPRGLPEAEPTVRAALAVCAHCPVVAECGEQAAAEWPHARGVWGGRYIGPIVLR